jgi:hypothetical protein
MTHADALVLAEPELDAAYARVLADYARAPVRCAEQTGEESEAALDVPPDPEAPRGADPVSRSSWRSPAPTRNAGAGWRSAISGSRTDELFAAHG